MVETLWLVWGIFCSVMIGNLPPALMVPGFAALAILAGATYWMLDAQRRRAATRQ